MGMHSYSKLGVRADTPQEIMDSEKSRPRIGTFPFYSPTLPSISSIVHT
jgi:hypothetical protein